MSDWIDEAAESYCGNWGSVDIHPDYVLKLAAHFRALEPKPHASVREAAEAAAKDVRELLHDPVFLMSLLEIESARQLKQMADIILQHVRPDEERQAEIDRLNEALYAYESTRCPVNPLLGENEKLRGFVSHLITGECLEDHVHYHNGCLSCGARKALYGVHDDGTHSTPPSEEESPDASP